MKKLHMLFAMVLYMLAQSAWAAPIGWYDLKATWRDGTFDGQFYYDSSASTHVTAVQGTLVDLVRTVAIDRVWNLGQDEPQPWIFLSNTNPADPGGHDAGFYLTLVDLGTSLTLDLAGMNGLYDWSDWDLYNPGQLDDSPLLSFSIVQANEVPEPASALLLLGGLAGLLALRRQRAVNG